MPTSALKHSLPLRALHDPEREPEGQNQSHAGKRASSQRRRSCFQQLCRETSVKAQKAQDSQHRHQGEQGSQGGGIHLGMFAKAQCRRNDPLPVAPSAGRAHSDLKLTWVLMRLVRLKSCFFFRGWNPLRQAKGISTMLRAFCLGKWRRWMIRASRAGWDFLLVEQSPSHPGDKAVPGRQNLSDVLLVHPSCTAALHHKKAAVVESPHCWRCQHGSARTCECTKEKAYTSKCLKLTSPPETCETHSLLCQWLQKSSLAQRRKSQSSLSSMSSHRLVGQLRRGVRREIMFH